MARVVGGGVSDRQLVPRDGAAQLTADNGDCPRFGTHDSTQDLIPESTHTIRLDSISSGNVPRGDMVDLVPSD
jgi:hypothetical protein